MHINDDECIRIAKEIGFNIVEVENKKIEKSIKKYK